ncbi:DUF1707 and DUF2154 domain-containing protein [Catenulispora sp. NF23]|uniref:DUF1707 and DUF2154 domain-containing protein n=1 Tax=Catenulispora pinistramenti TaxID=2705254 RepID=A0ABS5KPN0_9ACTN|nr:DUF1707 domain-containing protein [Catenulispora pinistramenti]MBS2535206.1 DUF1707 and DUF2154 domain-containing protein [Catenulispora pinistramenti]MBS2548002.1 DUF1707 and DUF2154 domain-containing protein [Catenulispora pinistramenti]
MDAIEPADAALRASDADRERAAQVLQAATADGRVTPAELEERLERVFAAKSRGELATIVSDLRPARPADAAPTAAKDLGVLSDISRGGEWVVGDGYTGTAVIGSGVIDLRNAEFTGSETTIRVNAWVSTVYVVVPPDVEVRVEGKSVLGGFTRGRDEPGRARSAAHRITVTGVAVLGTVHVVHELPPDKLRRLHKREQRGIEG